MRGSALWCAVLAVGLGAGCSRRSTSTQPPPPPPAPPDPGSLPDGGGQLTAIGVMGLDTDGGLAGLVGSKGPIPRHDHYPDWPRNTPTTPSGPRGLVELPPPLTAGAANAVAFDRKLRLYKGMIRSCYDRALRATPALAGEVTMEVSIGGDGKVLSVATPSSSVGNEVPSCLRAQFARARFPPPQGGSFKTTVTVKMRPAPTDAGTASP